MTPLENKQQDIRKILKEKLESLRNEDNPNLNELQVPISCMELIDVANSVLDLENEINEEALNFRMKLCTFIQFQIRALERMMLIPLEQRDPQPYLATMEKFQTLNLAFCSIETKIDEAMEAKDSQWDEIESLMEPGGLARILTWANEDPNGMEEQMKNTKAKIDGVHDIFKGVKEELDLIKDGINSGLDEIIQEIQLQFIEL
ncbi:unnamed protein product [Orchesella dallaii]|uniref:Dynactin subunit 3 n=1 Tax=Orchesella dallaii TaxID=48710 RepID=A0ABP1QLN3_9HEXA